MKLRKVISGGQTGADKTGLECAKALGLETGGTAPKGWRTDEGIDLSLQDFGLRESKDYQYRDRTRQNAADAEATLWFGLTNSPGYWCTKRACMDYRKPRYDNPDAATLEKICKTYEIVNVAGNRRRINPDVVGKVQEAFSIIATILGPISGSP